MEKHAFVLMSGGFDSTALAIYYKKLGYRIHPVKIIYDSRQITPEIKALNSILNVLHIGPCHELKLPSLANPSSLSKSRDAKEVEHGKYSEYNSVSTVVPFRNMTFISLLANQAEAFAIANKVLDIEVIASIGIHSADWAMYPDCRSLFLKVTKEAVALSSDGRVSLEIPFLNIEKHQIIDKIRSDCGIMDGEEYRALFNSYSCYRGGKIHCGDCPTCHERHEAFMKSIGYDLTKYEKSYVK